MLKKLAKLAPFSAIGFSGGLLELSDMTSLTAAATSNGGLAMQNILLILVPTIVIITLGIVFRKVTGLAGLFQRVFGGKGGKRRR